MTALATQYTCGEGDASTRRGEVSCEPVCRYLRASWWRLVCASCVAWSVSPAWRRRARLPRLPASRGRAARRREQREEEIAANRSAVRRDRMMLQKICTTKVETLRVLTVSLRCLRLLLTFPASRMRALMACGTRGRGSRPRCPPRPRARAGSPRVARLWPRGLIGKPHRTASSTALSRRTTREPTTRPRPSAAATTGASLSQT